MGATSIAQGHVAYSTHDSTAGVVTPEPLEQYREVWADVKSPGDGRQYSVGTIEVRTTQNAFFSGAAAQHLFDPTLLLPAFFNLAQGQSRQVVIVQCTDATPQAASPSTFQRILWQKYFYGGDGDLLQTNGAANARAISVWPAATTAATRIAICGETYDIRLPGSTDTFAGATAVAPTGFISVLDGEGVLLWTHHVFGTDPEHSCAITDVSIRVEPDGRETVTYCGISSHGDPGSGPTLELKNASVATAPPAAGTWGGIVGRVSRLGSAAPDVEFHSHTAVAGVMVGDGVFGLAEIAVDYTVEPPIDVFAVVGRAEIAPAPPSFGTLLLFDAAPTRQSTPANLALQDVDLLGVSGEEPGHTLARDVVLLWDGWFDPTPDTVRHSLAIVGSTTNADLFQGQTFSSSFGGGTDGFLMLARLDPPNLPLTPNWQAELQGGRFFGGTGDDGLTGVQVWNEYPDQISAAGFTQGTDGTGDLDIAIASYYLDTSAAGSAPSAVRLLRQHEIGGTTAASPGTADERPAAMGLRNATTSSFGLAFPTFGLGDPAGGGVAVDQRARVNVVGYTDSVDYPIAFPGGTGRARDAAAPADAVRSVFDMLPPPLSTQPYGVGRTDQTGDQGPFLLPSGMTGGTSPVCALSPFGRRFFEPAPTLARMLLDYEGDAPQATTTSGPPVNGDLIISRPTNPVFTAWQFHVPGTGGTIAPGIPSLPPTIDGVEVFVPDAFVNGTIFFAAVGVPGHSMRVPVNFVFPALPTPAPAMTVQVFCWFPGVNVVSGASACSAITTEMTASAAMWLPL